MAWSIGPVGVTGDPNERFGPPPPPPATTGAMGPRMSAPSQMGRAAPMRAGMMGTRMPGPSGRFEGGGLRGAMYRGTQGQRFNPGMGNQSMRTPAAINPSLQGGVRPGINTMGGPSFGPPGQANAAQIQAEMRRRQVGQQLGPRNAAVAGYMMGK